MSTWPSWSRSCAHRSPRAGAFPGMVADPVAYPLPPAAPVPCRIVGQATIHLAPRAVPEVAPTIEPDRPIDGARGFDGAVRVINAPMRRPSAGRACQHSRSGR
jgi:hypothetical protein